MFVVRYSGEYPSFYFVRILPFFFVFLLLAYLYLDDEWRRLIFSSRTTIHKPFSWPEFSFLLALVTALLADLAFTLKRVRTGAIALSVSPEGITGAVCHVAQLMPWSEIAELKLEGTWLVVRRHPRSWLQKLFASRGLGDINIPAYQLDRDTGEILATARRFASPALGGRR